MSSINVDESLSQIEAAVETPNDPNMFLVIKGKLGKKKSLKKIIKSLAGDLRADYRQAQVFGFGVRAGLAAQAVERIRESSPELGVAIISRKDDRYHAFKPTPKECKKELVDVARAYKAFPEKKTIIRQPVDSKIKLQRGVVLERQFDHEGTAYCTIRSTLSRYLFDANEWAVQKPIGTTVPMSSEDYSNIRVRDFDSVSVKSSFDRAYRLLGRLLTVGQNRRQTILSEIIDARLREDLRVAVKTIKGVQLQGEVLGTGYGVPLIGDVGPDSNVSLQIYINSNSECSKIAAGFIQLGMLGKFRWRMESIGAFRTESLDFSGAVPPPTKNYAAAITRDGLSYGTLGGFVEKLEEPGNIYGITCSHVARTIGIRGATVKWYHNNSSLPVAITYDWNDYANVQSVAVDAALVGPIKCSLPLPPDRFIPSNALEPMILMPVALFGASSNASQSVVRNIGGINCTHNKRKYYYDPVYYCNGFTKSGDSGAIVKHAVIGKPLGIHFGTDGYGYSCFLSFSEAATALNLS